MLVAISDRGLVEHKGTLAEVRKADQVPDRARELLQAQRQGAGMFGWSLTSEEFARVSAFLRARHVDAPKREAKPSPGVDQPDLGAPSPAARVEPPLPALPKLACRICADGNVEVVFGHSYYAKCRDCGGNTPIHLICPKCGGKLRTRKSGRDFYAECAGCETSARYHTNPA